MSQKSRRIDTFITVPQAMSRDFSAIYGETHPHWFVASDPPGTQLGSAGGTVYLLYSAWIDAKSDLSFTEWLRSSNKMVIHGGGRSRRLPSYGPAGKPFIPVPVRRTAFGERLDQTLIDLQTPGFRNILEAAADESRVLVTSGDVLLGFDAPAAPLPTADVVCFGMTIAPDLAQHFGVFFASSRNPVEVAYMKQKPHPEEIVRDAKSNSFLVDTGMWLLSEKAIEVLLHKSGWDRQKQRFPEKGLTSYDLYGEFGLALGTNPTAPDLAVQNLSCAVVALSRHSFLHLGTNRQLIESISQLQIDQTSELGRFRGFRHPDIYTQNSIFDPPVRRDANTMLWVENSVVPKSWELASEHVLTGIPANDWQVRLESGVCVDFVPVGDSEYAVRTFGFDDKFAGKAGSSETLWFGRPAADWFERRGIVAEESGIPKSIDIHDAPLFPVLLESELNGLFIEWLFAARPTANRRFAQLWQNARRVSGQDLNSIANLSRQFASRRANLLSIIAKLKENAATSVFSRVDLEATASFVVRNGEADRYLKPGHNSTTDDPLLSSKEAMFRAAILRKIDELDHEVDRHKVEIASAEAQAFDYLRTSLADADGLRVNPTLDVVEDQIVWGRSPIRLDLAGGWTDTPPYCFQHGGKVVNIAVDLNGQPPIQVYAKPAKKREIVIRSIDLGAEQRLRTYEDLESFAQPGSEYALAKAALALAGFLPRFHSKDGYGSLEEHLDRFGAGIEVSMLAAIPAGSGLGTSSMLAATLLGALGSLCRLNWSRADVVRRALVLEQMVTTGGGWQDPVGGVFRGLKLCETDPGLSQDPVVRWLPDDLFDAPYANSRILLYYTGITRLAKNILQDIVRGMFLNRGNVIDCLTDIGANTTSLCNAVQLGDYPALMEAVARSWELNQRLDAGTNPPGTQEIFERLNGENVTGKLLGAGGGGFMVLLAADTATGARVREKLTVKPLNPRARFVDISVSRVGLAVTRS